MRRLGFLAVALLLASGTARAQEAEEPEAAAEQARDRRPQIRVLHDPYELASFYRNENQGGFFATASERHPIASFYRGGMSRGGYSRFWNSGYAPRPYPVGMLPRGGGYDGQQPPDYRSRIGENGDLFLLAPTFLAPVGPLADVFFSVDLR
ncbi:MAG TPA: hypothetical protein VFM88_11090 [Vicinamibacteria bacterium]|nr:hypothetical protein [Vicinamibacteria bacterium]